MQKLIIAAVLGTLAFTGGTPLAYADSDTEEVITVGDELKISGYGGVSVNYTAGIIGVSLSDGAHAQGSIAGDHKPTKLFAEIWGSTPSLTDYDENFEGELDLSGGWRDTILNGALSVQADYSIFWVAGNGDVNDIQNIRLFVSSTRDGVQPYMAAQYFLTKDFGPGPGLGYKVGVRYEGFNAELGGHDGLFGTDAELVSFARVGYSTGPVDEIFGAALSATFQKGFADPIDDERFMFALTKGY